MARLRSLATRLTATSILGLELPLLALWILLAGALTAITERVADWNDMTDELVWERLAISVGQSHSPLPRLHGELIRNLSQLYPILLAPFFWLGQVPADLKAAHIFNAWLMTSAAIPAFLLARQATSRRWPAYCVALVTVCTPWLIYSTALLTEVAAYPLFIWAAYAMHRALLRPSWRNDLLALATLALAFFARTQFSLLIGVLPVAFVLYSLGSQPGSPATRARSTIVSAVRDHPALLAGYVVLGLAAAVYVAAGHHLTDLSLYGREGSPQLLSTSTAGAMTGHAADLAFGLGILPFLAGSAWLLAGVVRPGETPALHAFACLGTSALLTVLAVVAAWDLTLGTFVLDRYLFYLVPLLVLGFFCALDDRHRPRWSLLVPVAVVSYGFAAHLQESFVWSRQFPLSFESPIATPYHFIESLGVGRTGLSTALAAATICLALLFVVAARLVRPRVLTFALAGLIVVAAPIDTGFAFARLFSTPGHSGRPLTKPEGGILDWIDQAVGSGAAVTEVPYPVSTTFRFSQQTWRDVEFWNKSVRYDIHYPTPDVYDDAIVWFPNTPIAFDPNTGLASRSWSPYVVQSVNETRFRISGNVQVVHSNLMLIDAAKPWRTDWLTSGLFDDGWMRPHATVHIRVFSTPAQQGAVTRSLNLQLTSPVAEAPFRLSSNLKTIRATASSASTSFESLDVCVPRHGYADVTLSTPLVAAIPGDQRSQSASVLPRQGGLRLADLSLSDDLGPACSAAGGDGR